MFSKYLFGLVIFCAPLPALAHEFWIEPQEYQVESGGTLVADLKNGENFKGSSLGWFDSNFTRFEIATAEGILPVEGRAGDYPAMTLTAPGEGLLVVLHETTPARLTYREWEKFLKFAAHKDFPDAAAEHAARGWSQERFRETYTRHVKALVAVGDGAGQDRPFGLTTEIVALENPYDPDFAGPMQVQVLYKGAARADAQVEVFARDPAGTVTVTLTRTDDQGVAEIPVSPGYDYLLDAVVLRVAEGAGSDPDAPVWRTLWAALTFHVPR
ncbi:DUF4198 domain-containing protein [uncultured Roseobacter sp.]|uniref:DUF4198 domain-containing protein n=1 Tax=uncultured Roseobacter sp. TaxID=114847 RepID=UPI00262E12E9|nr:DUF4198 domain-containing protein [uncultured Roseobacter sp.]